MSAKKPIVVRIDGKQAKEKFNRERNRNIEVVEKIGIEEAAAMEESSENNIHTFAREYDPTLKLSKTKNQNTNLNMFKPIIIAIISAITIGSIMGFVMLKIIVNFDNDVNATPAYQTIPGQGQDDQNKSVEDETTSGGTLITLDPMSAFVLQGGVFSSASNAEAESSKFIDQGYSPVIWEKDSQYYLLVSSGLSKEDLQDDINVLVGSGIDVYAKEWVIGESKIKLSEEESNWVSSFQDQWNIATGKGLIEVDTWNKMVEQAPKGTESFNSFVTSLKEQLTSFNDNNPGQLLLAMWKSYDEFISSEQMNLE
ncbi:SPOR domain-containing protein [Paucisalibacillus globulus]|uniref:SPOR domain-containing protein n=1 Tax=Paucisalibacillus globulus TaxID=351095 RepID=UPI000BB75649|nr:SPOR domain-containing protein [Paucisalibacillus globulus]